MKSIKISTKISGMVVLLLLLMVVCMGFGILKLGHVGTELKTIADEDIALTKAVTQITIHQLEQAIWFERALRYGEVLLSKNAGAKGFKHAKAQFEMHTQSANKTLEEAQKLVDHFNTSDANIETFQKFEQIKTQMKMIEKNHKDYENHVHQAFTTIDSGNLDAAKVLSEKIEIEEEELDHSLESFLGQIETFTYEAVKRAEADEHTAMTGMIFLAIGVMLFGLTIAYFITRGITGPINRTIHRLKDIVQGKGDLTKRLEVATNDELGEMANQLNTFLESMQIMIRDISDNSTSLSSASMELLAISQQMSSNAEQTSGKANTVAVASEEMSTNVNSVASAMEQATTNITTVASTTEQMTDSVNTIARNSEKACLTTNEAVVKSKAASQMVNELGEAAQEISKVTEVITEISEQTNLLALNATIEAARAGESGKGFAVVANEIKELANQTSSATSKIKNKIAEIQRTTQKTVDDIEEISNVIIDVDQIVGNISVSVEEQSVASKEIANNLSQASSGLQDVNENVAQSSEVTNAISRDIAEVNQASDEISTSGSQVKLSAEELARMAEQLTAQVGRFKV